MPSPTDSIQVPSIAQKVLKAISRRCCKKTKVGWEETYPGKIKQRDGYITILDDAMNCHTIKESDLQSSRRYRDYLPDRKCSPFPQHIFRIYQPTTIVLWLLRIMTDDVPGIESVNLDFDATIDLHLAVRRYSISKGYEWTERLLAARVASRPWECLSRAWQSPDLDTSLARTIIGLLPSYHLIDLPNKLIDSAAADLPLSNDDGRLAITQLAICPLPTTSYLREGKVTLNTAPLIALALAFRIMQEDDPLLHWAASQGCQYSLDRLVRVLAQIFVGVWLDIERFADSAIWMTPYSAAARDAR